MLPIGIQRVGRVKWMTVLVLQSLSV